MKVERLKSKCRGKQNERWLRSRVQEIGRFIQLASCRVMDGTRIFLSKNASDYHIQEERGQGESNSSPDHLTPGIICREFWFLKTQSGVCMVHWYPALAPACSRKCHVPPPPQLRHTCCSPPIPFHREAQIGNRVLTLLLSQS